MQDKMLVDTCILFYLIDKTCKEKHKKALKWFRTIKESDNLFISTQNIREFSSVALRETRLSPKKINRFLVLFANIFELVYDNLEDVIKANEIIGKRRKDFWDALLVSTMERHNINVILTENVKHFAKFEGIIVKNPLK
jgi:predicted nucleic acid-binding protein